MKRTKKITFLGTALCLAVTLLFSCTAGSEAAEYYDIIKASCESALSKEIGEILIYESITTDTDLENGYKSGSSETYIYYSGSESPDFEMTVTDSGESATYQLFKNGETVIELVDNEGSVVTDKELPDLFENFRVNFTAEDIKKAEAEQHEKGVKCYKLTMKTSFVDSFDSEADGVSSDYTAVTYSFYIDSLKRLEKIVCEMTATVTADGQTQQVVRVIDSQIS